MGKQKTDRVPPPPAALTPELIDRVVQLLEAGNYREVVAGAVGLSSRTLRHWMRRGREDDEAEPPVPSAQRELYRRALAAERTAEVNMVRVVQDAARQDARHAQWWLERKCPQRWSKDRDVLTDLKNLVRELQGRIDALVSAQGAPRSA